MEKVIGTFAANDKGFGFVKFDPEQPSIFIAPTHTNFAMSGDEVEVKIIKAAQGSKGPEGQIEKITHHFFDTVVGEFRLGSKREGFIGEVKLSDKKVQAYTLLVAAGDITANDHDAVEAEVVRFPDSQHPKLLTGKIDRVIGRSDAPGVDILQVVYVHKVPSVFPDEVMKAAQAIPTEVLQSEIDDPIRRDIRDQPLVTIDGADTKDIDDSVVAWKLENGNYHLGVHIADVSHYVQAGSALDDEAYLRGTSVYLTDRVIPMLPPVISNGIASLNEGVDRLAMSVEMEINPQGKIIKHDIHQSVINSHARMTYDDVNAILNGDKTTRQKYDELVPMFETMGELHDILYKMRQRRGAIEFETQEADIKVDADGHPTDIFVRERGTAERLIESFMLAANETIAEHFDRLEVPFLYRIHEVPDGDRVTNFFEFMRAIGHPIQADPAKLKPSDLQNALETVAGLPEELMIRTMMLRAMKQAKYSPDALGHFGLGAEYYTHFTSPIRRYPDLTVHRLIKYYEQYGAKADAVDRMPFDLAKIGIDTSERERRAVDTERAVDEMKKAEFMEDKVGEEYEGVINSAMKFGLFISLPNTVEGLVHISNMTDDYYQYEADHQALIGRNSHRIFTIGQTVKVKVSGANKLERTVDFLLVEPEKAPTTEFRVQQEQHKVAKHSRQRGDQSFDKKRPRARNKNAKNEWHRQTKK